MTIVIGDINHKDTKDRKKDNRWTDDEEDIEVVCYFIWVPSEITEVEIRDNLYKQGYSVPKLMKWKEFEGLEYLKVVYQKKEDVQLILNQSFTINDIPVLTLPKVPNKTPLEMLVHYQLRIQSSAGSIEPKTVYEYLLKFGPIADFFSLDSSTIIVTFANNSSKNRLSACHSDNTIILSDDKQLKIEFNIKPALVTRKKLINTIFYSLNQEKYRTMANPLTTTSYYGDYNPKRGNYPDPSNLFSFNI